MKLNCNYQHSQPGRESFVVKLLEKLGTSERMTFEFTLIKLPQCLEQPMQLEESDLIKDYDANLLEIRPAPAGIIIKIIGGKL